MHKATMLITINKQNKTKGKKLDNMNIVWEMYINW